MKTVKLLSAAVLACALMESAAAMAAEPPSVSAASMCLVEASSGRMLAQKDADTPQLIASTTKIMTALIVLESCDPDSVVVIRPEWTGIEGSSMYLVPEQRLTIRELLFGLMLASGNDAATALACITAGSVEAFAERMNERARALGCRNTCFENPHGLDGEGHRVSAADLARITREALKDPLFREIVSSKSAAAGGRTYTNHNRLLGTCDGVFGVKTGYTEAAGRTLVTCCERNGMTLICVTLNDPDDWRDHAALYDWAYDAYHSSDIPDLPEEWTLPVIGGTALTVTVSPAEELTVFDAGDDIVETEIFLPKFVYAGIRAGESAGQVIVYVNGTRYASAELRYNETVPRSAVRKDTALGRLAEIIGMGERKVYELT